MEADFRLNKEEIGETVDKSGTIKAIKKHLNDSWDHGSFAMEAKVKEEQPSVTEADLSTIQDELGSFSTDAGGGERWKNLKNGVEKLNGTSRDAGRTDFGSRCNSTI